MNANTNIFFWTISSTSKHDFKYNSYDEHKGCPQGSGLSDSLNSMF